MNVEMNVSQEEPTEGFQITGEAPDVSFGEISIDGNPNHVGLEAAGDDLLERRPLVVDFIIRNGKEAFAYASSHGRAVLIASAGVISLAALGYGAVRLTKYLKNNKLKIN
jgi:hypothetical protein